MNAGRPWVRVAAPCKVNLGLEVLGKRDDGYHELVTRLVALDLADEVAVRAGAPGVRFEVRGPAATPDVPRDASNLVVRAAEALCERAGVRPALEIELTKHVPSRAGLGGGSSDAAAVVLATRLALGIAADVDERALLASLGSDTVFFAAAEATGHAVATGRGERVDVQPAPSVAWWVALCTPAVEAATGAVYAALALPADAAVRAPRERVDVFALELRAARAAIANDLERAACHAYPELARWRRALDAADLGHWRLAGSGSTWFGLYADERSARSGLAQVEALAASGDFAVRALHASRLAGRGRWRIDDAGGGPA